MYFKLDFPSDRFEWRSVWGAPIKNRQGELSSPRRWFFGRIKQLRARIKKYN